MYIVKAFLTDDQVSDVLYKGRSTPSLLHSVKNGYIWTDQSEIYDKRS